MNRINSSGPSISEADISLVHEAVREGWGAKMNYYIDMFIEEFADYVGTKYVLPTAHCTDAIHLAAISAGIGRGDEVIVPDLTWVASVVPFMYEGATPVFADVDPDSWCLTAQSIEKCITPKTKAVVVVDLLGNTPDWNSIEKLCRERKITIIEDGAEGLGAKYKGRQVGSFGEASLFSFNATKLIMSGQGGALCTNSEEFYKKAKLFSHHGIDKAASGKYYWSTVIGYNYNWTNIQAALALSQLRRIDELIAYKKWLFDEYASHLSGVEGVKLSRSNANVDPVHWITVAEFSNAYRVSKEELCEKFSAFNIDMRPMFYPLSAMPPFQKFCSKRDMSVVNSTTYAISNRSICLPNGNGLTANNVKHICDSFKKILNEL